MTPTTRLSRARAIQLYLLVVGLGVIAYLAIGPAIATSTALLVVALALTPSLVLYRVWPDVATDSAMDIMRRR